MNYLKLSFTASDDMVPVLIAKLSDAGIEGFEEAGDTLHAFVPVESFDVEAIKEISAMCAATYISEVIAPQNWNEQWESNFQPVIVPGLCTIRASFHDIAVDTPYEIVITPKMSFGTGHHATTQLMMMQMKDIDFKGKQVFDFGTGTGILAVFAEMLGAAEVFGVDNDEWSYENALENVAHNNCNHITIARGSMSDVPAKQYDVILANINRHILLQYMDDMKNMVPKTGIVLISGLLTEDSDIIKNAALASGLQFLEENELNGWISLMFKRP